MATAPIVGIDIGTQQIKAVEMRAGREGLSISAIGVTPTPAGVMQNNVITDPKMMGQAIRQLFRESGIAGKKVVGTVAGQTSVVIRIIEVPRMTDAELKETMKWEVERHVPFAPSETIMDYQALPPLGPQNDNNPNMEVLLAVAQQDIVSNFIDTVFAAGLDPIAIDIEPLAVARALLEISDGHPVVRPTIAPSTSGEFTGNIPGSDVHDTAAIVDIGASNTDISIFQDGQLVFPRSLPLAGDSLTRAISEILGHPLDQAERIKRDYAEVQMDKIGIYTGTAYGEGYEGPQFQEDAPSFIETDDTPLRNPFDTSGEVDSALGQNPFMTTPEGPQFDSAERTQPIPKRTLNLARSAEGTNPLPFIPPTGADAGLGLPGDGTNVDEQTLRNQVFEAIAPVLGELATELRRSLDYYRSRAQGRSVDRLILTGGSASLTNFAAFLQSELQVPVSVANPLQGIAVASKHYDPSYLETISPLFSVAVGLAARNAVLDANPVVKSVRTAAAANAGAAPGGTTNPPT